jgi:hypothetical protein
MDPDAAVEISFGRDVRINGRWFLRTTPPESIHMVCSQRCLQAVFDADGLTEYAFSVDEAVRLAADSYRLDADSGRFA